MTPPRRHQRAVAGLQRLLDLDGSLLRYADEWAVGFSDTSPGHGEPGGSTEPGTPTENRAIALGLGHVPGADLADRCLALHEDIELLIRRIADADYEAAYLAPMAHRAADLSARQQDPRYWGAGYCEVCNRYVAGNGDDRLRAGFCRKHYDAWRYVMRNNPITAPPLDRVEWVRVMRDALADSPSVGNAETPRGVG